MDEQGSSLVFKLLTVDDWSEAIVLGAFGGSPDDRRDGFIHLSSAHQLPATAAKYFCGVEDLCLVAFRAADLGETLVFEPSRGGELFPHVYGPLPAHAALWVKPIDLGEDGVPIVPDGLSD